MVPPRSRRKPRASPAAMACPGSDYPHSLPARSRSGCTTCRAKHLKCDETKPGCQMCTFRGVKCGGYQHDLRWSTKHEKYEKLAKDSSSPKPHGKPRRPSGRPERQSTTNSASSATSVPTPGHIPIDTNWGLFSDFTSENMSPPVNHDWDIQLLGPTNTTIWNHHISQGSLEMPVGGLHTNFDMLEAISAAGDSSDTSGNLSIFPVHQELGPVIIPPTITHLPSSLVEYWFQDVCSLWSQYDSPTNFNRTMASLLWSRSEIVSISLQSMSSAYLSSKDPDMKKTSISMMKSATKTIESELQMVKSAPQLQVVPMGLIYGLMCVGTSICWINATQLGIPFLREAKALLYRINKQNLSLSDEDLELLQHFNKSWTYCEMLLSVAGYHDPHSPDEIDQIGDSSTTDFSAVDSTQLDIDETPHPWTGVSTTVSRLFTQTMRLCHNHRLGRAPSALRDSISTFTGLENARALEERFLSLDFEPGETIGETGDQKTPFRHLVNVAKAYQLAGLLHLYQTFPDLVKLRLPNNISVPDDDDDAQVAWEEWITPLSLHLVKVIEQLPPDSGSKMTQPLLCITASTGLRFKSSEVASGSTDRSQQQAHTTAVTGQLDGIENCDMSEYIAHLIQADEDFNRLTSVTESRFEIMNARCFLLSRLNALEMVLPPRPIIVAKDLIRAIWSEYDSEQPNSESMHWVDIMEKHNLRSLFG